MKPIILKADQDGKILITADEIMKMVQDAYDEGYRDGRASNPVTITSPNWPVNVPETTPWWDRVTCKDPNVTLCSSQ